MFIHFDAIILKRTIGSRFLASRLLYEGKSMTVIPLEYHIWCFLYSTPSEIKLCGVLAVVICTNLLFYSDGSEKEDFMMAGHFLVNESTIVC